MEYSNGHLDGAMNIPVDSLRERLNELDKSKTIVEYCQVGLRGYIAARILPQNGFKVVNVTGGYKTSAMIGYAPQNLNPVDRTRVAANHQSSPLIRYPGGQNR